MTRIRTSEQIASSVRDIEASLRRNSQHLAILQSLANSTTTKAQIAELIEKNKQLAEMLDYLD